jgi:SET family sugar efflux transporter-like MFS transporter
VRSILDAFRRHPLVRTRALRQLTLANGLGGLSSAVFVPFLPLFLATSVGASATEIGLLLTLSGASGVLVSSLLGSLSDQLPSRKPLIAAGCVSTAAGDVVLALSHSYPVVLAVSVTLLTGAWAAVPQLYARGRELLDAEGAAPAPALSALRSAVSVAWIVGTPLAGLLLSVSGFPVAFLLVAVLMLAVAVLVVADGDPRARPVGQPARSWSRLLSRAARSPFPGLGAGVAVSAGAVVVLQTANSMSVTTMPLLVTMTLRGSPRDVGLIFGLAATLEIPVMLAMGRAAGRFGALRVMLVSWLFGLLYFGLVGVATATWQVALATVLSAIYVPGLVSVAIVYFQELLDEPGSASTLYFNSLTAGSTVAGLIWGVVVASRGYRGAYAACVLLTAASIVLLAAGRLLLRRPTRWPSWPGARRP